MSTYTYRGQFGSQRSLQSQQELTYRWRLAQDRLLLLLTCDVHRITAVMYRGDLEHFRAWLDRQDRNVPDLASALVALFAYGHDAAKALVEAHRDDMVAAGHAIGTVNRHLSTLRKAARVAREMGEIDWDLGDVHDLYKYYPCSNNEDTQEPEIRVRGPFGGYRPAQTFAQIEEER